MSRMRAETWLSLAAFASLALFVVSYLARAVPVLSQAPIAWHRLAHWPSFVGVASMFILLVAIKRRSRQSSPP